MIEPVIAAQRGLYCVVPHSTRRKNPKGNQRPNSIGAISDPPGLDSTAVTGGQIAREKDFICDRIDHRFCGPLWLFRINQPDRVIG